MQTHGWLIFFDNKQMANQELPISLIQQKTGHPFEIQAKPTSFFSNIFDLISQMLSNFSTVMC